ncbi:MAG: NAD-dependent epimerase/dehydratase family protein, partial [Thermoplasmata archaeon]
AENDVMPLADRNFAVTSLRQATVYGLSNRMRFDLAVNAMVLSIHNEGRIPVMRDGTQWRPFVHVKDAALAFLKVLEAESEDVNGHVFNVGSDDQNYQIGTLAEEIGRSIGVPYEVVLYGDPDKRSYRVSFDKIDRILGFRPRYSPREGAKEINRALAEGEVEESMSSHTLKWYIHLLRHEEEFQHLTVGGRLL